MKCGQVLRGGFGSCIHELRNSLRGTQLMYLKHFLRKLLGVRVLLPRVKILLLKNPLRESRIRAHQKELLRENYPPNVKRLIIFLTPGFDTINGGILSISSIYNETIKLKHLHGAETIMCTVPGDPLLLKYTKFHNDYFIYSLSEVFSYFQCIKSLLIHIPEYAIGQFIKSCFSHSCLSSILKVNELYCNIMLQNIDLLSDIKYIRALKRLKNLKSLTCTTAHERYSTPETEKRIGCILHKLSVYVSPEQYNRRLYREKENLIIVSPDSHPKKLKVLNLLAKRFPDLQIRVIRNLAYEEYKELASKAKWALTFGEGLDGYFVETIFSGGISFAVYNDRFFTDEFRILRTVYPSYEVLAERITSDIEELDNELSYTHYQNMQFSICAKYYNYRSYIDNLLSFYERYFGTKKE